MTPVVAAVREVLVGEVGDLLTDTCMEALVRPLITAVIDNLDREAMQFHLCDAHLEENRPSCMEAGRCCRATDATSCAAERLLNAALAAVRPCSASSFAEASEDKAATQGRPSGMEDER